MEEDNLPVPTIRKELKYDQSHDAMILLVRRYFEQELRTEHRTNLTKIFFTIQPLRQEYQNR